MHTLLGFAPTMQVPASVRSGPLTQSEGCQVHINSFFRALNEEIMAFVELFVLNFFSVHFYSFLKK